MIDLIKLKNQYDYYLDLSYVKSLNDPEEEPYKTKYEARKILEKLIIDLNENDQSFNEQENETLPLEFSNTTGIYNEEFRKLDSICKKSFSRESRNFLILKMLQLNMAKNYIETEEIGDGEKIISKIIRELDIIKTDDNEYNPLLFSLKLNSFNEMIYIWSNRSCYRECLSLTHSIEEMYDIYKENLGKKNQEQFTMPFVLYELINLDTKLDAKARQRNFESLYTHSLFFFAQIYGKLDEKDKSAYYIQLTLQRQLDAYNYSLNSAVETNDKKIDPFGENVIFDPLEWATHAAAMSQYYLCRDDYATSRYVIFIKYFA